MLKFLIPREYKLKLNTHHTSHFQMSPPTIAKLREQLALKQQAEEQARQKEEDRKHKEELAKQANKEAELALLQKIAEAEKKELEQTKRQEKQRQKKKLKVAESGEIGSTGSKFFFKKK